MISYIRAFVRGCVNFYLEAYVTDVKHAKAEISKLLVSQSERHLGSSFVCHCTTFLIDWAHHLTKLLIYPVPQQNVTPIRVLQTVIFKQQQIRINFISILQNALQLFFM